MEHRNSSAGTTVAAMFFGACACVAIGVALIIHFHKPPKEFTGVVMGTPSLEWKSIGGIYREYKTVKVFSPEFGTVSVHPYSTKCGHSYDHNLVLHKETYPPAQGKTIKVMMQYEDSVLTIMNAWAE